ncbi:MAG: DUF3352 domain-containing protein [Planctomycetota bacterium]|nr:DUF3352 domain-containing protein [Planctomycetota bacterium]
MLRNAPLLLLILAACDDLTNVPPPPVTLSALDTKQAAVSSGNTPTLRRHPKVRLIEMVPPGALACVHLPDLAGTAKRFEKTSAYKLLNSPEFEEAIGPIKAFWTQNVRGNMMAGNAALGFDPKKVFGSLKGDILICLEDVVPPEKTGTSAPKVRLFLAAEVPGATADAAKLLEFVSAMAAADRRVRVEKGTASGTPFSRVVMPHQGNLVVEFALHLDVILVGIGRETVTSAIDRIAAGGTSIEDQQFYKTAMARIGDPRDALRYFVDVDRLFRKYGEYLPAEARRVINMLNIHKVRSLAGTVRIDEPDITISTLLDSPGGEDVLTRLLARNTVDPRMLTYIPGDAASFSLFALDGEAILVELRKVLPARDRAQLEAWLDAMSQTGLDLERDILRVFGPRIAIVQTETHLSRSQGMEAMWRYFQGTVAIVEVKDPVRAIEALARLPVGDSFVRRRSHTVAGHKAVTYRFDIAELPPDFSVSYALTENYLYVALSTDALANVLTVKPGGKQSFQGLFSELPGPVVVLGYDNPGRGISFPMDFLETSPGSGVTPLGPRSEEATLELRRLMKGFNPTVSYVVADDHGVLSVTRSPTAGLGSMGGISGLLMVASIAIPNLAAARVNANEAAVLSTVDSIRTAEETYRARSYSDSDRDNQGSYGFLGELSGDRAPPGRRPLATPLLRKGYLKNAGHAYERDGYYFRVYLPAEDGSPVGGHEAPERLEAVDGDLAETVMVFVAWPVAKGRTGRRSFLMDAKGNLYASADATYEGEQGPPADALSSQKDNIASAPRRHDEPSLDGFVWRRLR